MDRRLASLGLAALAAMLFAETAVAAAEGTSILVEGTKVSAIGYAFYGPQETIINAGAVFLPGKHVCGNGSRRR